VTFEGHFKYCKQSHHLYLKNAAYLMYEVNHSSRTSYANNSSYCRILSEELLCDADCRFSLSVWPRGSSCFVATFMSQGNLAWRGGLVVGRRTCDLGVAGSRPGRDAAAQQP